MNENTPVISRSLSARVLFPWSMCAIMQKFLILSTGNLERSMKSLKKRMDGNDLFVCSYVYTYTGIYNRKKNSLNWQKRPYFPPKSGQTLKNSVMYLF